MTQAASKSMRWQVILRHLMCRGVNLADFSSAAFREPRCLDRMERQTVRILIRLPQDAVGDVINGDFFSLGKEMDHAVGAAVGRLSGSLRRCLTTCHSCEFLWKAWCVVLPTDVPAHRNQTADQETSSIPIWNSEQYLNSGELYMGQEGN
jgi:hypothetical protein